MTYADQLGHDAFLREVQNFFAHDYHDRGMLKWQGYFLSDHTAALKKQATKQADAPTLPAESTEDIRVLLAQASQTGKSVEAQLATRDKNNALSEPFTGKVKGQVDGDIVVIGARTVFVDELRAVRLLGFSRR